MLRLICIKNSRLLSEKQVVNRTYMTPSMGCNSLHLVKIDQREINQITKVKIDTRRQCYMKWELAKMEHCNQEWIKEEDLEQFRLIKQMFLINSEITGQSGIMLQQKRDLKA